MLLRSPGCMRLSFHFTVTALPLPLLMPIAFMGADTLAGALPTESALRVQPVLDEGCNNAHEQPRECTAAQADREDFQPGGHDSKIPH
jgi:hypothetical protein